MKSFLHHIIITYIAALAFVNEGWCVDRERFEENRDELHPITPSTEPTPLYGDKVLCIINNYEINSTMGPVIHEFLETLDSKKVELDSKGPLSTDTVLKLRAKLNSLWTYNSNVIEGNCLSMNETRAVVEGITVTGSTFRDIAEVDNHYAAIEYVESVIRQKTRVLTNELIRNINFSLLHNILPSHAGKYRKQNVRIRGALFDPPHYTYVEELMEKLLVWYYRVNNMHPIIRISIFHAKFELIHPFMDGNGRTGRLIMNMELMKLGYPPAVILNSQKQFYYKALASAQFHNQFEDLTQQIAHCVESSLNTYLDVFNPNLANDTDNLMGFTMSRW